MGLTSRVLLSSLFQVFLHPLAERVFFFSFTNCGSPQYSFGVSAHYGVEYGFKSRKLY